MHTSNILSQADFYYRTSGPTGFEEKCFADLFPDYHPQDRIGIISPCLEDGIIHTPSIILGLTTAFYDHAKKPSDTFFNYPQHFAFIGGHIHQVFTGSGAMSLEINQIGAAWGGLDVWPETNWIIRPDQSEDMLAQIYGYQINRVFWPATLIPENIQNKLSPLTERFLRNRLKSVWYYGVDHANVEVGLSQIAMDFVQGSISQLPHGIRQDNDFTHTEIVESRKNRFQIVTPDIFLDDMAACFNSD